MNSRKTRLLAAASLCCMPPALLGTVASHSTSSVSTVCICECCLLLYRHCMPPTLLGTVASHSTLSVSTVCIWECCLSAYRHCMPPLYSVLLPLTLHHQCLPSVSASVASQHTDIACLPLYSVLLPLTLHLYLGCCLSVSTGLYL